MRAPRRWADIQAIPLKKHLRFSRKRFGTVVLVKEEDLLLLRSGSILLAGMLAGIVVAMFAGH